MAQPSTSTPNLNSTQQQCSSADVGAAAASVSHDKNAIPDHKENVLMAVTSGAFRPSEISSTTLNHQQNVNNATTQWTHTGATSIEGGKKQFHREWLNNNNNNNAGPPRKHQTYEYNP